MPRLKRFAYTVASMILIAQPSAQSEPLGRLFFSPDERSLLDARRSAPKTILAPIAPPAVVPPPKKQVQSVLVTGPKADKNQEAPQRRQVMTGFVERSSGANTVWTNNQAQHVEGGYGELDPLDVGKARRK